MKKIMLILPLLFLFVSSFGYVQQNETDTVPSFEKHLQAKSSFKGYVTIADVGRIKCKEITFYENYLTFSKNGLSTVSAGIENVVLVERRRRGTFIGAGIGAVVLFVFALASEESPSLPALVGGATGAIIGGAIKSTTTIYVNPKSTLSKK